MQRTKDYSLYLPTEDDVFEIVAISREAFAEDFIDKECYTFSSKRLLEIILHSVTDKNRYTVCLKDGDEIVGYFFGALIPCYFAAENQAICVSWFIRPEHRSVKNAFRLLKGFEKWGKEKGASVTNMTSVKHAHNAVYERLGYELTETTFTKRNA